MQARLVLALALCCPLVTLACSMTQSGHNLTLVVVNGCPLQQEKSVVLTRMRESRVQPGTQQTAAYAPQGEQKSTYEKLHAFSDLQHQARYLAGTRMRYFGEK